jgi:multidrug resistance efflux pump
MSIPLTHSKVSDEFLADATALRMVGTSRLARGVAWTLLLLLGATTLAMFLLPWQQTVTGKGQVVARSPLDRQQAIPAPIGGRIVDWYGHREGSRVKKGERILKITDNDPAYLERLQQSVEQAKLKLTSAQDKVESYDFHVDELLAYRDFTVIAAESLQDAAEAKVRALREALAAAEASLQAAKFNLNRKEPLYKLGYDSARVVELARLDVTKAETDIRKIQAELEGAVNEVQAKQAQRDTYEADAKAKIAKAQAERNEAQGDIALAQKEVLTAQTAAARQATQDVLAPCDGIILRLQAAQAGDVVKPGDPLFIIVPDRWEQAVEIWVDGNDATLVEVGRPVRLVFEGFPGIQFAGWPSVAVGSFGGRISLVDASDNGQGMFRVLVVPDSNADWPAGSVLRQGVRANGWVLLDRVTLGYELWRKLNGFPPVIAGQSPADKEVKKPKK